MISPLIQTKALRVKLKYIENELNRENITNKKRNFSQYFETVLLCSFCSY